MSLTGRSIMKGSAFVKNQSYENVECGRRIILNTPIYTNIKLMNEVMPTSNFKNKCQKFADRRL